MSKALYKVLVKITGNDLPYVYQFDNGTAAWDFCNAVEKMEGVVEVTEPDFPTTLYGKASLPKALASIRDMAAFAHNVK